MEDTIGKLNAQLKILLVEPSRTAADRQDSVRRNFNQPYNSFHQFFNKLKIEEKGNILCLALEALWEQFRDPIPDLDGKVGNAEDPGDGLLYGLEQIDRANALLKDLHQAWTNMEDYSSYPPPEKLPRMGMICLILMGMRQQRLLEDFLNSGICDDDLHLSRAELQRVLPDQHPDCAGTFLSEQYRAKPRAWDDGHHVKMEDEEPLPLKHVRAYKQGSYGHVSRVYDAVSGKHYALKEQVLHSRESDNAKARRHLKNEIEPLRRLKHRHVIRLAKSYERATSYGLLIAPAASCDLNGFLNRFHKNKYLAQQRCYDQEWMRPIILTAFGCLSQGLAYIHEQDIRHKDIKPGNILFDKASGENGGPNFLWADFGLAHDFSATGNSKTYSTQIYSKRYAAPEIYMSSINPAGTERLSSVMSLDRIVENGETRKNIENSSSEEKILSGFKEDKETSHGRETDIFSLGCVFLELLAALVHERLPMDHDKSSSASRSIIDNEQLPDGGRTAAIPIADADDNMFCKHIPDLKAWARAHSAPTNTQISDPSRGALTPLLTLAGKMISLKAEDRPSIQDVVGEIAAVGNQHFCQACWTELPAGQKARKSTEVPTAVKDKAVKPKRTGSASPESPESSNRSLKLLPRRPTVIVGKGWL